MEKFYIVRSEYHSNHWLYAMCYKLADALQLITDEHLPDAAVEFCRGSFPFDYEVYKTLFHKDKGVRS